MDAKQSKRNKARGWAYLTLWLALIVAGIVGKRVYGQPDLVPFFHLPAALFLILGWYELSHGVRDKYKESLKVYPKL